MAARMPTRRQAMKLGLAASAAAVGAPALLRSASAQDANLAPYQSAKMDWRQASGETITVAVIPASYFDNLITLAPQFEALTGIAVRFEKIPPAQIRQKSVIDLTSKTATYATHAADPMYYALYSANKWVEPLDPFLKDASLTDPAWFKADDIVPNWRAANTIDGKLLGIPYDGEVTLQVYRKDLYEAKGLKAADDLDAFSQGTVASYIDAHSSASVVNNAEKSKVIGKVAYARWPKGPSGKRVSSIWNWGFPINAALTDKRKKATWLFIQWAASEETQARTAHRFAGPAKRSGVNRTSVWRDPDYVKLMRGFGDNFVEATMESLQNDTDVDWRPRVPQWPAIGDTLATAVQSALAGQATAKAALDEAQKRVEPMMRG